MGYSYSGINHSLVLNKYSYYFRVDLLIAVLYYMRTVLPPF
jgi:hypothetical protein